MEQIRIATWNVGWTSNGSRHFEQSRELIAELDADVLVLTETTRSLVPDGGFLARGGPDWGYETQPGRRKVMLWSRWPITDVSNEIAEPGGRHVSATVQSAIGPVRVHAVCLPWSHAHVSGGLKSRRVWEDHLSFLVALGDLLRGEAADPETEGLPLILAGDINQREQPRPYGGHKVRKAWAEVLKEAGLTLVTDEAMIDKVAIGPGLAASDPLIFPPEKMSDHHAVSCLVRAPDRSG
jgi:exonuclease III